MKKKPKDNAMKKTPRIAIPIPPGTRYVNYFNAVSGLGAEGVAVTDADVDAAAFDGLLLPGGVDVDPSRYGQENTACGEIDAALDATQFALLDAFVRLKKPVFGVCRGHQVINVYFGGTLIQDLPQSPRHKWDEVTDEDRVHGSAAVPGSWIAGIYGASFPVNSAHHQAADRVGEGLVVDQWSDDGIIEAMHHASLPVYSVQWHPERMCFANARADTVDGKEVLRFFVDMCKEI